MKKTILATALSVIMATSFTACVPAPKKPNGFTTCSTYYSSANSNEFAFDEKYRGKSPVYVYGRVSNVKRAGLLGSSSGEVANVYLNTMQCILGVKKGDEKVKGLMKGQYIKARCQYAEHSFVAVQFYECSIL